MTDMPWPLQLGSWQALGERALALRIEVFVHEQGVPLEMEYDAEDPVSLHALLTDRAGAVLATGRLLPDGHIGRLAVHRDWRGRGLGAAVLQRLMDAAWQRGQGEVLLHAQCAAEEFYRKAGFVPEGEAFVEAGIPHRLMRCTLAPRV